MVGGALVLNKVAGNTLGWVEVGWGTSGGLRRWRHWWGKFGVRCSASGWVGVRAAWGALRWCGIPWGRLSCIAICLDVVGHVCHRALGSIVVGSKGSMCIGGPARDVTCTLKCIGMAGGGLGCVGCIRTASDTSESAGVRSGGLAKMRGQPRVCLPTACENGVPQSTSGWLGIPWDGLGYVVVDLAGEGGVQWVSFFYLGALG